MAAAPALSVVIPIYNEEAGLAALFARLYPALDAIGQDVMAGRLGLDQVAARALERNQDTKPVSGRQELLENLLNSYL